MKRAIIGYVRVVEYGTVEITVPDTASEADIIDAILEAEDNGDAHWGERTVVVEKWDRNPDYDDYDD